MTRAPAFRPKSWTACSSRSSRPRESTAPGSAWPSALASSARWAAGCGSRTWREAGRLSFELPIDAGAGDDAARSATRPAGKRLALLVVEDEDAVRRAMALLAKRLGHEVT